MATKNLNLGIVPVSRGEFNSTTIYYKDNIVQYKRGSYQVVSESPIIGISPTDDKNVVNPGWTLFAGTLDAQDVVNQVKDQETKSVQAVADREAEILAKSDAAKVSFDNTDTNFSGTNVQDALKETSGKLSELESEVIYDVTANNDGATFSSLSALLSSENLSTLIPTSVRHGGMSIRFVQSSDNKYVQYRLMNQNWSTVVTDWQGIDNEPTAGSINLVESGGVETFLINKCLIGSDNKIVNTIYKNFIPNTLYCIDFVNPNWNCSDITIESSYNKFYINNHYNGTTTTIINYSLEHDIPQRILFTVPSNSDYIEIGIRANNGIPVHFTITMALNFIPLVYFSNGESPIFERLTSGIKITMPSYIQIYESISGKRIYGSSTYSGTSFTIPTAKKLVFDCIDNTIKIVGFDDGGQYIDLLSVYKDNCFGGALANYYNNIRIGDLENKTNIIKFEIGNINFGSTPWTYSNTSTRVRTPENQYLHLNSGDKITLTDYTNAVMYIGWKVGSNYYSSLGWLNSDFTCFENGDYAILVRHSNESTITDATTLSSLIKIIPNTALIDNKAQGIDLNVLNPDMFEIGNISVSTSAWHYSDLVSRVRLKENSNLHLRTGDVIKLTDYSFARFYVGYRKNGTYYTSTEWKSEDFVCPMDAEYTILIAHNFGVNQPLSDKWQLLSLLRIQRGKECVMDIASSWKYSTDWLLNNDNVKAVNHRGYNKIAPENTLPAFKLSSEKGFKYIELDIQFTSDGIPVILHDATIDRTSDGTGNIADMTYAQVSEYDFGSWKSEEYAGTKIPTFEEVLQLCKKCGLSIYVELKTNLIDNQATLLGNLIKKYGMQKSCTFFSGNISSNQKMGRIFPNSRIGYVTSNKSISDIENVLTTLKSEFKDVFLAYSCFDVTRELEELCISLDVEMEIYGARYYGDYANYLSVTGNIIDSIIPDITVS